jgi:hypothetical protein
VLVPPGAALRTCALPTKLHEKLKELAGVSASVVGRPLKITAPPIAGEPVVTIEVALGGSPQLTLTVQISDTGADSGTAAVSCKRETQQEECQEWTQNGREWNHAGTIVL